jgi:hypothetical protein
MFLESGQKYGIISLIEENLLNLLRKWLNNHENKVFEQTVNYLPPWRKISEFGLLNTFLRRVFGHSSIIQLSKINMAY